MSQIYSDVELDVLLLMMLKLMIPEMLDQVGQRQIESSPCASEEENVAEE
jgi:hypothetical protein